MDLHFEMQIQILVVSTDPVLDDLFHYWKHLKFNDAIYNVAPH